MIEKAKLTASAKIPHWFIGLLVSLFSRAPFNRGSFRVALSHMVTGLAKHPLLITFRSARFAITNQRNPIEYGMLLNSAYNAPELDFLSEVLGEGDVAVDLGSNIGMYTITMAAKVGETGKIIAVDASASFMKKLRINAAANDFSNISFENIAVGGGEGEVQLNAVKGNPGTATVTESTTGGIPMQSLMTILERNKVDRISAMKVDIDGFEEKALGPFFAEAKNSLLPKRVVVEAVLLNDENAKFVKTMLKRGYVEIGQTRSNALLEIQK